MRMKIRKYILRLSLYILALVICWQGVGCERQKLTEMEILMQCNHILDESRDSVVIVLRMLDTLDFTSMDERDRMFACFLKMKARDKNMVVAKNDSIFRMLRMYYSDLDNEIYPELLYYGGRTYSDIGDYPKAVAYYDSVLKMTYDDRSRMKLRSNTLIQKSWILSKLNILDDRIRCVMETTRIDSLLNDSVGLMYDLDQLGDILLDKKEYDQADYYFRKSLSLAEKMDTGHRDKMKIYLAVVDFRRHNLEGAYRKIHELNEPIEYRGSYLANAARIYDAIGKTDTAFLYASRLVKDSLSHSREVAYQLLLSEKYGKLLNKDTLLKYVIQYQEMLHKNYATSMMQQVWLQNTMYNYSLHDRDRAQAESTSQKLRWGLLVAILLILAILLVYLYYRYIKQKEILTLQKELEKLTKIEKAPETLEVALQNPQALREEINKKLAAITEKSQSQRTLGDGILESPAYITLQERIVEKKIIGDEDELWIELEKLIEKEYPDFLTRLHNLTEGKMKLRTRKVALLARLGVNATAMKYIFGKEKGTISYWRKDLVSALIGSETSSKKLDDIIFLL